MATRHNLNTNPGAKNNVTGWQQSGANAPAQATGLSGAPRTTGAIYTSGTYQTTSLGAASPATQYTMSVYVFSTAVQNSKTLYANFTRSAGGDVQPNSTTVSIAANTWTRVSITVTSPALTTGAGLLLDGANAGVAPVTLTAMLVEQVASLDTYFDGDTSGATWDGTNGNSASTLASGGAVSADAALSVTASLSTAGTKAISSAAALSVTASLTAAATKAVGAAAALAVTASLSTAGTKAISPAAALSIIASLSTAAADTIGPAAALAVTGTLTATATSAAAPKDADADLSATATLTAAAALAPAAGGPLAVIATLAAAAFLAKPMTAALSVTVTLTASATNGEPPEPESGGSWETLRGIVAEARADHARNQERIQNPIDCPEHQWPLEQGPDGVLHCKFGGHTVGHGAGAHD
jgi:hypothetical protein